MKTKYFIVLLFSSLTKLAFTQFNPDMENKNKWGWALAINSIQAQVEIPLMTGSGALLVDADGNILTGGNRSDKSFSYSIIPKYHINNDILIRFEFGITNLNLQSNYDQKGAIEHVISNTKVTNIIYRYAPGFQWTFMKTKKLESYCGITASYIDYKSMNRNYYNEHRESATDTLLYWGKGKETTPGGFALGIGALAGFNIYMHKSISLGAELSTSALYYKLGGVTTGEETAQSLPNPSFSYTNAFTNSYKGFKISKIISSFNISVWF